MGKLWVGLALAGAVAGLSACDDDPVFFGGDPASPVNVDARYFDRAVFVTWDLPAQWNGESFRVYSKRTSDADYFLIADVTNCSAGLCSYTDVNIVGGATYQYFVAAVDPDSGVEASSFEVVVSVPIPTPPPVPGGLFVVGLDGAAFIEWDDGSRAAADFSFYRVYVVDPQEGELLLGETDSEGFLDLLALNGQTMEYRVSSVDEQGHESALSASALGTPRPDFHGEIVYAFEDRASSSGFRFQESDDVDPIVSGSDPTRHFRLEIDASGWWLVPGPGTQIHAQGFVTTTLKCGVTPDPGCSSLDQAPAGGYTTQDVSVLDQTSYPMIVTGDDGATHFAVIRVDLLGSDQGGDALMIFDWAYQLQAGNPELAPRSLPAATRGVAH